jgi:hypothetical protein
VSFGEELEEGAWGAIVVPGTLRTPTPSDALVTKKARELWKIKLLWVIAALIQTESGALDRELEVLDNDWDLGQQTLQLHTQLAEINRDPDIRDAARRARARLLSGAGLGQTRLAYHEEVDFGRRQVRLAAEPPLREDIAALGLQDTLAEIHQRTEALAVGLGRRPGGTAALAPSQLLRFALRSCVSAFNSVLTDLDWLAAQASSDELRKELEALREPMQSLLDRYSNKASTPPTEQTPPSE